MLEKLSLHPISGKKEIQLTPIGIEDLRAGSELHKIINTRLGKRNLSFIERDASIFDREEIWRRFRNVGLPVIPTFRNCRERRTTLETNLRRKWPDCEIYGKSDWYSLSGSPYSFKKIRQEITDKLFLQLTDCDAFSVIEDKVRHFTNIADNNFCLLPVDDPFELVLQKNGKWQLMILDLTHADYLTERYRKDDDLVKKYRYNNSQSAADFLDDLKETRRLLIKIYNQKD